MPSSFKFKMIGYNSEIILYTEKTMFSKNNYVANATLLKLLHILMPFLIGLYMQALIQWLCLTVYLEKYPKHEKLFLL